MPYWIATTCLVKVMWIRVNFAECIVNTAISNFLQVNQITVMKAVVCQLLKCVEHFLNHLLHIKEVRFENVDLS